MKKLLKITFQYMDDFSNGKWKEQECVCSSIKECKELYGLGIDCSYKIVKVEELNEGSR